ncbi:predicted protein [Phaeodactylum tricornutum CCAP 1055/1]|uniref:RNA helicase n=1 Tax=Phaeodactylum tricornutum (strain CCAP 1055/1) TaxID=556484 RepID=B7FXT9_PHATC|nr:predicted protein [Phaeodactylum tricornutum CCAP 1055/1]EEC48810.1 predicted protein [Phaeodactylum tricornutum CCAP 1055/1]|eukprot:XP_002179824.1 predicted protein [Phaeodactylum tricornutum CCAP 1055/1]
MPSTNKTETIQWCSDALHDLLGFADTALASYLVSVAKKATQSSEIVQILVDGDVRDVTPERMERFAEQLLSHARPTPKQSHGGPASRQAKAIHSQTKTNADWVKAASSYQLIDVEISEEPSNLNKPSDRRKGKKDRQDKRDSSLSEPLTPAERVELEREKDLKERDELVQRMMERDQTKTKQKAKSEEKSDSLTLERLREESRRAYLKKREERELALLKQSLQDEEDLFRGAKLTEAEKKRIQMGKQILSMVEERDGEEDKDDEFYRLPGDFHEKHSRAKQQEALLTSRYNEPKLEKSEQDLWEESQTQKAGAIGGRQKKAIESDGYELLFDDQIDFVMQETREGYDKHESLSEMRPATEHEKILEGRTKLPVYAYREEFLAAVKEHQILILVGETGSGKTTQIPQFLNEVGYGELGKIGCTQPRRVAAMSVAARVAQEMNVRLGHEVGYSIRFENCTSPKTILQYMTDGMLLREILTQPDLASYSCMVIDEAHERTLHTDILFGLVKDIVRFRSDLKLIVSSATLDAEKFSKYFDDASIFMIPGRMFPVDTYYTKAPEADYVDAAVVTVLQIHVSQPLNGDVLVFLTGQEEIETAAETLSERSKNLGSRIPELIICPIYANLPSEQQAKIFEKTPSGARKVVLATNIAETSLTIDGICYVIDTGFNKQKTYNARSGMESLVVTPISQAAANQRAGRAGRTQPGKCFRLFTAWSFQHELEPNTVPEILRTNMGNVVLMLKSLGINDLLNFDFMDRPPADALIRALEQLYALGALNDRGELTKLGRRMAEFPLDPMLSKSVIVSEKYECTSEVLSTVAMLSLGASVFYRPKEKAVHADTARLNFARGGGGDHIALLRCYSEWAASDFSPSWCFENFVQVKNIKKARDIREQLAGLCDRVEIDHTVSNSDDFDATLKTITAGFFYNIAKLGRTGEYQTAKQHKTVYIHPSSVMAKEEEPPPWLVFFELTFTTKEFMRQVAPIKPSWLVEIAPHYYQETDIEDSKTKKMPRTRRN